MKKLLTVVLLIVIFSFRLTAQNRSDSLLFKNPALPLEERVDDLVSRMTLSEKIAQMMHDAPAIPRLEIPAYNWWNECLHGVARAGIATVFPQAIGLATTWNEELIFQIAEVISTEARAKHHEFVRQGQRGIYQGLTFWSPNINIFRDPRWGRGQETFGEDPYLTSRLGVAFVKGLQGNDPKYFKVIATPKHFAVHSGPEPDRHHFDALADKRDLFQTYLPAFEACVSEGGAFSIMCAYNRYLGDACCAHPLLLQKVLREEWGFEGYVVSDCRAIRDIYQHHKIVATAAEAAALAVKAGTDLNCGKTYASLLEAVEQGLISENEIDVALKRLFTARFRLGMFDPPESVSYASIPIEKNDCAEHRQLALRAAQESIVLLKNDGNLLPLPKNLSHIAVIGPNADDLDVLLGNYHGTPSSFVTPLKGIQAKVGQQTRVSYEKGCSLVGGVVFLERIPISALSHDGTPGLQAEYFNNTALSGKPILLRTDPWIDSNWEKGASVTGLGSTDFSVRWTGLLTPPESGEYVLAVTGDDGYRLYLDDKLVIDHWSQHVSETRQIITSLSADIAYTIKLEYFQGQGGANIELLWEPPLTESRNRALALAEQADVTIFVGGISPRLEGEEKKLQIAGFDRGDRTSLDLPATQQKLLEALQSTGKPLVLVLMSGSALTLDTTNRHIPAVVQLWYPGEEGGTALADVLFGDFNPAGRLPVTFYQSVEQLPPFDDYHMAGRTYRYFSGEPLYPFGFGLSYSRFNYNQLSLPDQIPAGDSMVVSVEITNTGALAGDEVVQLYVRAIEPSVPAPLWSLQGFKRIHLAPGQRQIVRFNLLPEQLALINHDDVPMVEPGRYEIAVGGILPGFEVPSTNVVRQQFRVVGEAVYIKR